MLRHQFFKFQRWTKDDISWPRTYHETSRNDRKIWKSKKCVRLATHFSYFSYFTQCFKVFHEKECDMCKHSFTQLSPFSWNFDSPQEILDVSPKSATLSEITWNMKCEKDALWPAIHLSWNTVKWPQNMKKWKYEEYVWRISRSIFFAFHILLYFAWGGGFFMKYQVSCRESKFHGYDQKSVKDCLHILYYFSWNISKPCEK